MNAKLINVTKPVKRYGYKLVCYASGRWQCWFLHPDGSETCNHLLNSITQDRHTLLMKATHTADEGDTHC